MKAKMNTMIMKRKMNTMIMKRKKNAMIMTRKMITIMRGCIGEEEAEGSSKKGKSDPAR